MRPLSPFRWLPALLLAAVLPHARAEEASCPQLNPGELTPGPADKLLVTADRIDGASGEVGTLTGSVRVQLGLREFRSDALQYDDAKRLVLANKPSQFRNEDYVILSRSASYDLTGETGIFRDSEFTLLVRGARGRAEEMQIHKDGHAELSRLSYTSCAPGRDSWRLTARELRLDREQGMGTARDATLRLGPVPVLYTPYIQFPIDDERHTGLLFPTIGSNSRTGFDARWPVYLNLAPNYDAVLTPRLMSDRGTQIGASGRYLLERGAGNALVEYLPSDAQFGSRSRTFAEFGHEGLINRRLGLTAHYAEASDPNYFEDLSFEPGLSTQPYLDSNARLVYQAPASYTIQALVQKFQPLAGTLAVDDPYQRLPELRFDGVTRNAFLGARAGLNAQATNFARTGSVQGTRQVVRPSLQWARDDIGIFGAVQTDLHLTRYQLRDADDQALDDRNRILPITSLDGGLRFAKRDGDGSLQILEPRLFYLYVPYRDQSGLPVFDAGEPDYDFPQLFARNRFIGEDRIADANQLTTALTYRLARPDLPLHALRGHGAGACRRGCRQLRLSRQRRVAHQLCMVLDRAAAGVAGHWPLQPQQLRAALPRGPHARRHRLPLPQRAPGADRHLLRRPHRLRLARRRTRALFGARRPHARRPRRPRIRDLLLCRARRLPALPGQQRGRGRYRRVLPARTQGPVAARHQFRGTSDRRCPSLGR